MSPTMDSELYVWKVDAYSTAGVGIAFAMQMILQNTALAWITPYIDPGIAVIMTILLLPEPFTMTCDAIKSLILAAPKTEVIEHIREIAGNELTKYDIQISFLDVIKTGRKLWVDIYIIQKDDLLSIKSLQAAQDEILKVLNIEYEDIFIELIPELNETP